MSHHNRNDGSRKLENPKDLAIQWFNNSPHARRIILGLDQYEEHKRPFRRRADRSASINDVYDMISQLMPKMQLEYVKSNRSEWLLFFPNMIVSPRVGDNIYNETTKETYSIKYIPMSPDNKFTGSLLLNTGIQSPQLGDVLSFENADGVGSSLKKEIQFMHYMPSKQSVDLESSRGDTGHVNNEPFTPTIVASLRRQEPGTYGKRPFDIQKEVKPTIRETFPHPQDPTNYSVEIRGQRMDNIIRFTCFDTTHAGAGVLVDWFRDFMQRYSGVLKKNGVSEILYWQRRSDERIETWRDDIVGYPVEFYFRTEDLSVNIMRNITTVNLNVRAAWKENTTSSDTGIAMADGIVVNSIGEHFATIYDASHDDSGNFLHGNFNIADEHFIHTG